MKAKGFAFLLTGKGEISKIRDFRLFLFFSDKSPEAASMELTMEERRQFTEFVEESKIYRKSFEDGMNQIKTQVSAIQLVLAEEKGKDIPARLLRIEHELELLRTFRDSVTGSINSIKWFLGIGLGFISSLLVGLIILVVREMMVK